MSSIIGPDGEDLTRADAYEALILAKLDRDLFDEWRAINTYTRDRRPDLYHDLSE